LDFLISTDARIQSPRTYPTSFVMGR